MSVDPQRIDLTRRMAEAMYDVASAAASYRDMPSWMFVSADTATHYCAMAQAARRVAEADTDTLLDKALDIEGEYRGLIALVGDLLAVLVDVLGHEQWDPQADVRDRLADVAALIGFDHEGQFDDATD
jgi:hypothetical protein